MASAILRFAEKGEKLVRKCPEATQPPDPSPATRPRCRASASEREEERRPFNLWLSDVSDWVRSLVRSDARPRIEQAANAVIDLVKRTPGWKEKWFATTTDDGNGHEAPRLPTDGVLLRCVMDIGNTRIPDESEIAFAGRTNLAGCDPLVTHLRRAGSPFAEEAEEAQQPHWTALVKHYLMRFDQDADWSILHLDLLPEAENEAEVDGEVRRVRRRANPARLKTLLFLRNDLKNLHVLRAFSAHIRRSLYRAIDDLRTWGAADASTAVGDSPEPSIPPRAQTTHEQYKQAAKVLGTTAPTDREAYDVLAKAHQTAGEAAELPTFATWQRNLREYRRLTGTQKNRRRAGRGDTAGRFATVEGIEPQSLPSQIRPRWADK